MSERCAECGGVLPVGRTCQHIFDECLALELTDHAFGKVHMLTVACFMIQHGRYSEEALSWIGPQVQDHLNGVPARYLRQRAASAVANTKHPVKILRDAGAEPQPRVDWSVTIVDVVPFLQDADAYCEQIERWARATVHEMKAIS
ncbi:hypothetical protein KDW_47810 [Dictyobacter vulcani]|uniref:Uncharacterized protein n=1 Tax=Dictyobacter vulcani TaxID=2607529 RepID=A0A5J4KWW2_9CHLR|nr:DUF5946 family protein [Dictyobacter vulcani]GER90619.1 hypothetical protein KDW_47810 [Dictyobacter vulcani]